ncbi:MULTISPECIES: ester cyclase [unclassified Streptomyces]|uniref:ester cyclase n=1 Tax=unclassified Streptomyces TaxID=2593676 RepID=UPI001BEB3F66|nr:ester cyclase [Streptomyces sp. McG3]MBT2896557.1 ester cyclase [Streptomyces sp. McG3]
MDTTSFARRFLEGSADDDRGDCRGNQPSGRAFETTRHVTSWFEQGRITESWFDYDLGGALEQIGAPPDTGL